MVLGEFELIASLTGKLPKPDLSVVCGIGDDAAAIQAEEPISFVTCDSQVDGVHFLIERFEPEEVGRRAAAVNLSDVAAMGGVPKHAVVSLLVPPTLEQSWVQSMYKGLAAQLQAGGASIVGGNVASTTKDVCIDVTLIGVGYPETMLLRSGACPGDILCVTGNIGASHGGLKLLSESPPRESPTLDAQRFVLGRYKTPTARLREGLILGKSGAVTSCIDISDGLLQDAGHLAKSSGVSVEIDVEALPVASHTRKIANLLNGDVRRWALGGGEDFELLFTVKPDRLDGLKSRFAENSCVEFTPIGRVMAGEPSSKAFWGGQEWFPERSGFDHLKKDGEK